MGFSYRRRINLGKNLGLNVSKRGISTSARAGRVTINSSGRGSIRLFKGLSFRFKI